MADEYVAKLKKYINVQIKKGYDKEVVIKHLIKSGISRRQIAEAADGVKTKKKHKPVLKSHIWCI